MKRLALDIFTLLARLVLGVMFVYTGWTKAMHPEGFLKLLNEYHLFSNYLLLNLIASGLPWFEVFCGLLLIAGIFVRGTALMLVSMLVPFTIVVFNRALGIAAAKGVPFCTVKFDCGCGTGEVFICHKMIENSLLTLLALWLVLGYGRRLCMWFGLEKRELTPPVPQSPD